MITKQYVAIVECFSNGRFYLKDIERCGLSPLVIYPNIEDATYLAHRAHVRDRLTPDVPVIDAPDNLDELLELLSPYNIVCVLAGSEYGVELSDQLAHRLKLPGNNPLTTIIRRNKAAMQATLEGAGLRAIRSRVIRSCDEADAFFDELGGSKVVLKPVASAGTQGVHFCENKSELRQYFNELTLCRDYFGADITEVLMQEHINGVEYIVNTASSDGKHRITDIWRYNKVAIGSEGNAYDYARLVTKPDAKIQALIEYAYQVLDALDFSYGPAHGEFFIDEKGPVLIEIAARPMGGGFSPELLDHCLGHHLTDCALDSYLAPDKFAKAEKMGYHPRTEMMIKYFISPNAGVASSLPLVPLLKSLPSFREVDFTDELLAGELKKTVDLSSSPAYCQLCHADAAVLMNDYETIRSIEQEAFELLFSDDSAYSNPAPLDIAEVVRAYHALPTGERVVLVNSEAECRLLAAHGIDVVFDELLNDISSDYAGGDSCDYTCLRYGKVCGNYL